ncbi:predicted protein [Sclerotinia sclerotiorum 1980 UF-70]|uniref:Uncharacterized protein n=2 Tax=Sclerotinia sclerotiorum (strain ATCC 18683 / 1980 / Ss-1) TaxID=665079 RepID=A7F4A6_SCLS1|nr:predicted protein [Sclerotinia sclerotiorum 1980 UF-70]APA10712.1 hypothetical protein sscle_06g054820 [Sclerotinia sclerotiorum 1980 UF-70]EDN97577.1 predicted protein [Sclerotinia sclerotiorum 1980 UF-70]
MFQSSKHSKITLHKKLFAPVSITSARGSSSSTEPKATIPVLLPPEPDLEVEAQTKPQAQALELGAYAQSSNITSSTPKPDLAASLAAAPITTPIQNVTLQPNHHSTEPETNQSRAQPQPQPNSNNIQVLPPNPNPPRSPFYSASSSTSIGTSSSQQMSNHTRNFSSTSTITSNFGSPPPSYTPFVTPSLSPQAHGYRFGDGNAYGNTNGYGYRYRTGTYTNARSNQYGHGSGYPSPSISRSPSLQLPDLVDEVLRLRDRLNFLESGSLSNERGSNRGNSRTRSAARGGPTFEEERKEENAKESENQREEEIEGETKRARERWEEIEKFGLGYEDFLEEFYRYDDEKEVLLELNEESFGKQLGLELKFGEEKTCGDILRGRESDGSEEGDDREPRGEIVTLAPSVFVDEGSHTPFGARSSSPFPYSLGFHSNTSSSASPISSLREKDSTKESQLLLPKSGCHYFITAGFIQNITIIYPVSSLSHNMDALKGEKEIIRSALEGWNRGAVDKYGIHPTKRAYAAIIYPEPQAPLPRKKLRIALSFTPIYPSQSSSTSSNPIHQTPTNPEDIITDANIYISTVNDSSTFSQNDSRGVMDYKRYKVKYGNQEVHERHDGILEVGRLRAALGCEVFKMEGSERENGREEGEERWEKEEVQLIWKDDGNDESKWEDEKKGSKLERGVQVLIDTNGDIEGGWI